MTGRGSRRYRSLLRLAGAALLWERLWPRIWPAIAVVGVFVAVALLDLLPALPGWLHALVLFAFLAAFVAAVRYGAGGFRLVDRAEARRRIERDSGLDHRPLAALDDRLATGVETPAARSLWEAHLRRMAATVENLSVRPPAPEMARREPWGIRAGVVLVLVIGLAAGAGDAGPRLERALTPHLAGSRQGPVTLELWITPPAYTGVAPLFLDSIRPSETAGNGGVEIPRGSTILARASGLETAPGLVVGDHETPFTAMEDADGPTAYRAEAIIEDGYRLAVRSDGRDLAAWALRVIADRPPSVAFSEPPNATVGAFLGLAYEASDDYGIDDVTVVIRGADEDAVPAGGGTVRLSLPLPALKATSVAGGGVHDLTAHPLAGEPVLIHLEAEDTGGQTGSSDVAAIVLPEKAFSHPVARAIVAERKRLSGDSLSVRGRVALALKRIAGRPAHFADDTVVSLALAVSAARLVRDRGPEALPSVRRLLWDTALRIEEGDVPVAERELRNARQRLWEALRRDSEAKEIERLMDELQRALDRYLAAMAAELARRGETGSPTDLGISREMLRSDDLRELIDMARQLARTGARDSARQLLAELQRILDGLRMGLEASGSRRDLIEAHKLMQALRNLGQRQQDLLDKTFQQLRALRAQQDRREPGEQAPWSKEGAAEQDALRRELGEQMLRLDSFIGGIPPPVGKAERAMRGAVDALDGGRLGTAVEKQTEAVDHLNQAVESAGEAMARRLGGLSGMFAGDPDDDGGDGGDIFGRSPEGGYRGMGAGQVKIPDRIELHRAQEILRELRRRAGERHRPPAELGYIERLLRRF